MNTYCNLRPYLKSNRDLTIRWLLIVALMLVASCNQQNESFEPNSQSIESSEMQADANVSTTSSKSTASVESLIGGLAERLRASPNDPDGWALLAKSYYFLGNTEKAIEAEQQAKKFGYQGAITQHELTAKPTNMLPPNHPPISKQSLLPSSMQTNNDLMLSVSETVKTSE